MLAEVTSLGRPANAMADRLTSLVGHLVSALSKPLEARHLSLELDAASRSLIPDSEY